MKTNREERILNCKLCPQLCKFTYTFMFLMFHTERKKFYQDVSISQGEGKYPVMPKPMMYDRTGSQSTVDLCNSIYGTDGECYPGSCLSDSVLFD